MGIARGGRIVSHKEGLLPVPPGFRKGFTFVAQKKNPDGLWNSPEGTYLIPEGIPLLPGTNHVVAFLARPEGEDVLGREHDHQITSFQSAECG